ncbi:MAG: DUF2703 domain-containing protein [Butyricicoccus sp.]
MAKRWYPVIDRLSCTECGICVNFCSHGVYDKKKFPFPVVVYPEGCIDHCHGCGNKCPQSAISYVGEDTGWIPPEFKGKEIAETDCGCGCGYTADAEMDAGKKLRIEYLYLDLNTCDRCIGTDAVLDNVIEVLRPALELAGYEVDYQKREMTTAQLAKQYHFLSSPTILVNGHDILGDVRESNCGCCGEIAGVDVNCRVFEYEGKSYEVPTKEMLANAILKSLNAQSACSCDTYELPENLKRFYEGKMKRAEHVSSCGCSCSCKG